MLKKRLIFTLLLDNDTFQLSRNFSLQAVGNLEWLYAHFDFDSMAHAIDELVLLNVGRTQKSAVEFSKVVGLISKRCFMPIAAGGGIVNIEDAYNILGAGADKVVVNTALYDNKNLVNELVSIFGSQCVVASIDYKYVNHTDEVYTYNSLRPTGLTVAEAIKNAEQLGIGEIYLTSIDRDGTGQGYDLNMLRRVVDLCQIPIIASGGVGDFEHFVNGMKVENVTGTSTANIFNFLGEGFAEARSHISKAGIDLARWDFKCL